MSISEMFHKIIVFLKLYCLYQLQIMDQLWIEGIRRKLRIEKDSCVSTDIKIVHGDKKTEFMENYVEELQKKTKTFFLAAKQNSKNYYFHACERGNKPTGKSMGKACETRANSCEAYVSFKFIEETGFTAVSSSAAINTHGT